MIIEERSKSPESYPSNEWESRNSKKGILRPRFMGAADYVFYLRRHLMSERRRNDPTVGQPGDENLSSGIPRLSFLLRRLEEDVQSSYLSFLDEFVSEIHEGISCLLHILRTCQERQKGAGLFTYATCSRAKQNLINRGTIDEFYCLLCLKACSKSSTAVSKISEHKTGLSTIASSISSSHIKSRIVAIELLTIVCRAPDMGNTRVLEAMTTIRILFGESVRFKFLVSVLNSNVANSSGFETVTLIFLNTIVDRCEKLSDRVRIQSELEEAGLDIDCLEKQLRQKFGNSTHRVWNEIEKWRELKVDLQDSLQKHQENIKLKKEVQLLQDALKRLREERKGIFSIHKQLKGQWNNMEQRLQDIALKSRVLTTTSSSSSEDEGSPPPRHHDSELDEILIDIPTISAGSLLDTCRTKPDAPPDSGISSHSATPDDSEPDPADWQYPEPPPVLGRPPRVRFDEALSGRRSLSAGRATEIPPGALILPPGQNRTRYADIIGVQNSPPAPPLPQRPATPKSKKPTKKRSSSSNRDKNKSFLPRSLQRSKSSKSTGNLTFVESSTNFQLAPALPKYKGNNKLWNKDLQPQQNASQRPHSQIGSSLDGMIHREIAKAIRDRHALFDP